MGLRSFSFCSLSLTQATTHTHTHTHTHTRSLSRTLPRSHTFTRTHTRSLSHAKVPRMVSRSFSSSAKSRAIEFTPNLQRQSGSKFGTDKTVRTRIRHIEDSQDQNSVHTRQSGPQPHRRNLPQKSQVSAPQSQIKCYRVLSLKQLFLAGNVFKNG